MTFGLHAHSVQAVTVQVLGSHLGTCSNPDILPHNYVTLFD